MQTRTFGVYRPVFAAVGWIAFLVLSGGYQAEAQVAAPVRQPGPGNFLQFGEQDGIEDGGDSVYLPTDRSARIGLKKARQMVGLRQYGEAVRFLGAILESPEDSFFQPDDSSAGWRSLKSEAGHILAELPAEGRDSYQLQFGARAKKMLASAVESGDVQAIAEVSRKFFHTQAGYEATLLAAQYHLDHGHPLAAAFAYQQLLQTKHAADRFEPALSVLAATSWLRAGMEDRARAVLLDLKRRLPNATVRIAGQPVPVFTKDDVLDWLVAQVGKRGLPDGPLTDEWLMYRGDGRRNAKSRGGRPLLFPRWRVRTMTDPSIEDLIGRMQEGYRRQGISTIPSLHPLAVDNLILMRTVHHLYAVDFKTGKRVWEVRPHANDAFERLMQLARTDSVADQTPMLVRGLEQRMWVDATYGTLSSDGDRVYLIEDLDLLTGPFNDPDFLRAQQRVAESAGPKPYNRLTAIDLKSQGKRVWEVGPPDSDEDFLTGAFFLGPPLPHSGFLYALAEIKGGISLVVLEAETGKLVWTQQLLANLDRNIVLDPIRRLAGAMPSIADQVLICPTSAGAVVAVDLTSRSLLWAQTYGQKDTTQRLGIMIRRMRGYQTNQGLQDDHWIDGTVTIVDRRVVVTPVESDQIYCFDLLDGSTIWTQDRGDNLYVACVDEGKVILVGKKTVTALELKTGKIAWENMVPLPGDSMPSGRGCYSGDHHYYLPLSSAEVVKIDLAQGAIVERIRSIDGVVSGNLISYRDEIISHGVDWLETHYQIEPLQAQVTKALQKNADDAEALARLGEIELFEAHQGRADVDKDMLAKAISLLRRSFELAENERTRELLVAGLMKGLKIDFAANRHSLEEIQKLGHYPDQQIELLRLIASGLQQTGEIMPAFDSFLQLVKLEGETPPVLEDIDDQQRSIRRDRWIQGQLAGLQIAASANEREEMNAAIAERVAALEDGATSEQLRSFLGYFGAYPQADIVRDRLSQKLLESGAALECQLLLGRLEKSKDPQLQRAAIARMALLLKQVGQLDSSVRYFQRLNDEFANDVCLDGKTGKELAESVRHLLAGAEHRWPRGEVHVTTAPPRSSESLHYRPIYPVEIRGGASHFFDDIQIALNQQLQSIVGYDGHGNLRFRVSLNQPNDRYRSFGLQPAVNYAMANGHLLLVSMGYQIFAVDTLRAGTGDGETILWKEDLTEQVPGTSTAQAVRASRLPTPAGLPRYRAEDSAGRRVGVLGPILSDGVAFQRGRDLVMVDPIRGDTLWMRHDIQQGCEIFGDEEILLVVPQNGTSATVLRVIDGAKLGVCEVPPENRRMLTSGRRMLDLRKTLDGQELCLIDPWAKQELWSRRFPDGTKFWTIDEASVAAMEPSGAFVLLSLEGGQPIIEQNLLEEPNLADIYMLRSRDQYHLITNRPPAAPQNGRSVAATPGGHNNPIVSGRIYAFDRRTGKLQWPTPATVEQHGLLLSQPSELPMLAFVRRVVDTSRSSRNRTQTSVLCIDRRTGREIYRNDKFSFNTGFFTLEGDPGRSTVTLTIPSTAITMTFSGEPAPPEPPAQAELGQTNRRGKGLANLVGSIANAIGRMASDAEPDFDPFGEEEEALERAAER